jgi:hypothetical protein
LKINAKILIRLSLLLALSSWIIYTPSHFQKGGVDREFYYYIALFVTVLSLLITIQYTNFHWLERLLIAFPISFTSLFLTTIILGPMFVELLYGDKTFYLWETNHSIMVNAMYYGLNTLIVAIFSFVYFNIRRVKN